MHAATSLVRARAQFTLHFIKEIKKLVPHTLLSYVSTWDILGTLEKCEKHSPAAHASLGLLSCS